MTKYLLSQHLLIEIEFQLSLCEFFFFFPAQSSHFMLFSLPGSYSCPHQPHTVRSMSEKVIFRKQENETVYRSAVNIFSNLIYRYVETTANLF